MSSSRGVSRRHIRRGRFTGVRGGPDPRNDDSVNQRHGRTKNRRVGYASQILSCSWRAAELATKKRPWMAPLTFLSPGRDCLVAEPDAGVWSRGAASDGDKRRRSITTERREGEVSGSDPENRAKRACGLGRRAGCCEEVHGLPRRGGDAADRTDVRPWMVVGGGWEGEERRRCRREVGDSGLTAQAHKQASTDQGGRGPSVHSPAAGRLIGTRALPVLRVAIFAGACSKTRSRSSSARSCAMLPTDSP